MSIGVDGGAYARMFMFKCICHFGMYNKFYVLTCLASFYLLILTVVQRKISIFQLKQSCCLVVRQEIQANNAVQVYILELTRIKLLNNSFELIYFHLFFIILLTTLVF